jgi:carbonic anhydrase/acetyltransferase-like protein (isoleucine patch superfamily)
VGAYCLIGIGAIVLDGAEIGDESVVAAGALVPEGMKVPARSLVMGVPAKVRREVTEAERQELRHLAQSYVGYKDTYLAETSAASERPTPSLG